MDPERSEWEVVEETPPTYEVVRPHYFGLTPRGLVVAIALVALVLGVFALATGSTAVGVLLLAAALFLVALYVDQARRSRDSSLDRIAAAAVDHTKAVAGFTGASVRAWTGAGRRVAQLRVQANLLARERSQLQYALGGACLEGDEVRAEDLREQLERCVARLEACTSEAQAVVADARKRTSDERLAVQQTEIRRPG